MNNINMLVAGFGGQGVLFMGKIVAYTGLIEGKEVSWMPSYGPEMRGGTANCSICISKEPIGSPIVITPNIFVPMNSPSYDKFIDNVEKDGFVFVESSLIDKKVQREDVKTFYVPATELCEQNGLKGLANLVMLGKIFKETSFCDLESLKKAVEKSIPPRKANLITANIKALELGMSD